VALVSDVVPVETGWFIKQSVPETPEDAWQVPLPLPLNTRYDGEPLAKAQTL